MRKLSLTIIFLCFSVNASAQFGGSFIPEGPNSTYQIFSNTNKFVGILDASDITVQQALEDLSFIVASPTTVTSEWNFANGNLVLPQGTTCPNAGSCTDGAICYDTNATSGQRVYACESGTWTLQGDGGAGGGDSITINSTAASDAQFTESLPSVPASGLGVKWQIDTSTSPDSVSAYAAVNTSSVLAGVLSDETGSGGGVVFATSPTITSPTISTSVALPASAVDAITEIASALKSGADTTLVTGTAGGSGNCAQWNVDGDIVDSGAGCGGGSGDNILINGSAVTDANFNESNPSTPASGLSVKWQTTGSSATQITGYAAVSTSAILAGVLSDETGSSGGVVVFSSTPTIATPIETGKIDRNNVAVDDDDCTGEQGLYWYDTTDSRFEFCDDNSGVPSVTAKYLIGAGEAATKTDTFWLQPFGVSSGVENTSDQYISPEDCTASTMYAEVQTAPGAGNSWTVCANVNGTVLTEPCCAISGTAVNCSELVSTGTVVGGQTLNWEFLESGTATGTGDKQVVMICTP